MNANQSFAVNHGRGIERSIAGMATSDGAGVRLTRLLTQDLQSRLDPFLMLDCFGSERPGDYIAGFPDHPHRGFEAITFMLAGRMRHRDSAGHEGLLESGGVQWMTAGRGVIHSELPEQEEGLMEGFQLWLNLPAADKLCSPWYRDFPAGALPRFSTEEGASVQVIGGLSHGVAGAVRRDATQVLYLDVTLAAGGSFAQILPPTHNAFVCLYRGEMAVKLGAGEAAQALRPRHLSLLANSPEADGVRLVSASGGRAILLAGRPLGEAIVQHGPFVMNTLGEIRQAISDYSSGRFAGGE